MTNVIERAVSSNLYFTEIGGQYSTQDLYHLELQDLDRIYKALKAQEKEVETDSLLSTNNVESKTLTLKIAVVTHIVQHIQKLIAERTATIEREQMKDRIDQIIEAKKLKEFEEKSLEDLVALREEL